MLRWHLDVALAGLAVVILDVRADGVDLLPDPLGYLAAAFAFGLATRHGFPLVAGLVAAVAFALAALLAVPGALVPPPRPPPGLSLRPPNGFDAIAAAEGLLLDAALAAALLGVAAVALRRGAAALAAQARGVAIALLVLFGLTLALDLATLAAGIGATWPYQLAAALAGFVMFVLALVVLWRARALAPPPAPDGTPAPA